MSLLKNNTRKIGADYEQHACNHCQHAGLKLIDRNYHCRQGEIDLIMLEDDTLVFIEVRYRKQNSYGSAIETVTRSKQRKLLVTAQHFLQKHAQHQHRACRFDVIGINTSANKDKQIHWVKNAFME